MNWRALAIVTVFVVTHCSVAQAGPLRVAEDRLPRGFNPLFTGQMVDLRVATLLFTGLYSEDRYNRPLPVLVEKVTQDPSEPRRFEIRLESDLHWHDGHPLTADDVIFTIDVLKNPATGSPLASLVAPIVDAQVCGRDCVVMTFVYSPAEVGSLLTFPILPRHAFHDEPVTRLHPFRFRPIGNGPYSLKRYDTDATLQLVRDPGYALGSPEISRIELREIRDKQIQIEALRFGNLEVVVRVLPRDLPDLEKIGRIELRPYQTNGWWYIGLNMAREPWSSREGRLALCEIVDVDALLAPIGGGDRISGPFVPASPFYNHHAGIPMPAPDLDAAAVRLESLGFARDTKGRWARDGSPLEVVVAVEKGQPVAKEVAVNLEGQLRRAGLGVRLVWLDGPGWDERVVEARDFDITLSQWSFDRGEDVFEQFHSKGLYNYVGYSNPQVDELLELARSTHDPELRRQACQEVHLLLAHDRPYLFLWTLTQYAAFSTVVRNVSIDPFTFYNQVHRWTMDLIRPQGRTRRGR